MLVSRTWLEDDDHAEAVVLLYRIGTMPSGSGQFVFEGGFGYGRLFRSETEDRWTAAVIFGLDYMLTERLALSVLTQLIESIIEPFGYRGGAQLVAGLRLWT